MQVTAKVGLSILNCFTGKILGENGNSSVRQQAISTNTRALKAFSANKFTIVSVLFC